MFYYEEDLLKIPMGMEKYFRNQSNALIDVHWSGNLWACSETTQNLHLHHETGFIVAIDQTNGFRE